MASGNQSVKTPTGWNATQGAWVKTGSTTWKAVDQIYIKTPTGWNNASGQEATQQPYPYIANSQTPYIANAQQPYPYIANSQTPYIANARQPAEYQNPVNGQEPNIRNAQTPFTYQATGRSPFTYQHRSPFTYQHRSPFTYNLRSPFTYQHRSPFTYRNPVNGQQPNIRDGQTPFTYDARYPANAQQPSNGQTPFTYNARYPANARQPVAFRSPFTYRVPYIANARQPVAFRSPFTYRVPYIANARQPNTSQQPFTYHNRIVRVYFYGPSGGGCFSAGTMIWMGDGNMQPIENIVMGDVVYGYNMETGLNERVNVVSVMEPRDDVVYNVTLENGGWLHVTGGHPFYVEGLGWKVINMDDWDKEVEAGHTHDKEQEIIGELEVGDALHDSNDSIIGHDLQESIIASIEEVGTETVYHFSVDGEHHNFYANNLLVHNFSEK